MVQSVHFSLRHQKRQALREAAERSMKILIAFVAMAFIGGAAWSIASVDEVGDLPAPTSSMATFEKPTPMISAFITTTATTAYVSSVGPSNANYATIAVAR